MKRRGEVGKVQVEYFGGEVEWMEDPSDGMTSAAIAIRHGRIIDLFICFEFWLDYYLIELFDVRSAGSEQASQARDNGHFLVKRRCSLLVSARCIIN